MFYKERYLKKGGRFHGVWLAAHHLEKLRLGPDEDLMDVCLDIDQLLHPTPLAAQTQQVPSLRLASELIYGTARYHAALTRQLLQDTEDLLYEMEISRNPDKLFYSNIKDEYIESDYRESISEESTKDDQRQLMPTTSSHSSETNSLRTTNGQISAKNSIMLEITSRNSRSGEDATVKLNFKEGDLQPRGNRASIRLDDTEIFVAIENYISIGTLNQRKDASTSTTTLSNWKANNSENTANFETARDFSSLFNSVRSPLYSRLDRSQSCPNSPLKTTHCQSPIIVFDSQTKKQNFVTTRRTSDIVADEDTAYRSSGEIDQVVINESDTANESNVNRRRSSNYDPEDEPSKKQSRTVDDTSSYQLCFFSPNNDSRIQDDDRDVCNSNAITEQSPSTVTRNSQESGEVTIEAEMMNIPKRAVAKTPGRKKCEQKNRASLPTGVRGVCTAPNTRRRRQQPTVFRSRKDLASVEQALRTKLRTLRNKSNQSKVTDVATTIHAAHSGIEDQQMRNEDNASCADTSTHEIREDLDTQTPSPKRIEVTNKTPSSGREDDIFDRLRHELVEEISCVTPPPFPDNSQSSDENIETNSIEKCTENTHLTNVNIHNRTTFLDTDKIPSPRHRIIETVAQVHNSRKQDGERIFITLPSYKHELRSRNVNKKGKIQKENNSKRDKINYIQTHFSPKEISTNNVEQEESSTYTISSESETNDSDKENDDEDFDIPSLQTCRYNVGFMEPLEPILEITEPLESTFLDNSESSINANNVLQNQLNVSRNDNESEESMDIDEPVPQENVPEITLNQSQSTVNPNLQVDYNKNNEEEIYSEIETVEDIEESFETSSVSSLGLDCITYVCKRHGPTFPALVFRNKLSEDYELNKYVLRNWRHRF